jgi:hypothetical protein
MNRRPTRAKMIAELFETLIAILHSTHWAAGRKVRRKDYHRFADLHSFYGSFLQTFQARNGH